MKLNKILSIFFVTIFLISMTGCNNSTNENKTQQNEKKNQIQDQKQDNNKGMNKDEYKELLTKSYDKYIQPLDIKEYDDLENLLSNNSQKDINKFVEDFKLILDESKSNINEFSKTISNLKIEDEKLSNLNNELFEESQKLVKDIDNQKLAIDKVDKDILTKPIKEILDYLNETLIKEDLFTNKFDEKLQKIEDYLGIDLQK
ncbi:hypothetical protein CHF27_005890 [Romboutsia maritimum]|uniref:Lipoprotein n=1 Tax=Romboutsia maritimum TaxID=2020948 RepID=A0A255HQ64_9FIRM|nr:hypothetical protein [Romboutsia maritimum]RDY23881.1 hypothetical protein CHF27_005890 [Romboutsia maritimum]